MTGLVSLLLGGARSGKSGWAERLARRTGQPVVYLATAVAGDGEMAERIAHHRGARPASWRTIEEPEKLAHTVRQQCQAGEVVVIDCLTLWVSNVILRRIGDEADVATIPTETWSEIEGNLLAAIDELFETARQIGLSLILVSNEVGLGLVPPYRLGRRYRDMLGRVNRAVASRADQVLFLIAGLPVDLGRLVPSDLRQLIAESNDGIESE
jgi:adenosylcobinamide kinase/adenosylcobinamide-phosphate guanylyltransferase